jgi:peroxiredoxin
MQEAPDLASVSKEFDGRVQFLGIDILDEREAARDFILRYDWPYPHLFDPTGAIRDALGYIGQPVTILYDRSGKLAFEWDGIINANRLRKEIRKVL